MISIVIPTYNRAKLIHRALDSVLAQTYDNWECIVVDDHSTDETKDVVEKYIQKDERFKYIVNNRTKGAQGARNTGIMKSMGDLICLFDSDDIMYPNYLEKMFAVIDDKTDVVVCKALIRNTQTGEENGRLDQIFSENMHMDLIQEKAYVAFDVTLIRKDKLIDIGLLDEQCPSMQEWDTHIRLSKIARYIAIDETLCEWFSRGEDAISTDVRREVRGHLYVFAKHQDEWKKDKDALRLMIERTYMMIQLNRDFLFRINALVKLTRITLYTIPVILNKRLKTLKRLTKRIIYK